MIRKGWINYKSYIFWNSLRQAQRNPSAWIPIKEGPLFSKKGLTYGTAGEELNISSKPCRVSAIIYSSFSIQEQKHGKRKWFVPGHRVGKWCSQDLDPVGLAPSSSLWATMRWCFYHQCLDLHPALRGTKIELMPLLLNLSPYISSQSVWDL